MLDEIEKQLLESLFFSYYWELQKTAFKILRDQYDAQDAVQTVFANIAHNPKGIMNCDQAGRVAYLYLEKYAFWHHGNTEYNGERHCTKCCDDLHNETCRFEQAALQGQLWFDLYHNAANLIQPLDEVGWYSVSLTDGA